MDWREHFFKAKYHFSIVERMTKNYETFPDKRVFIGILNESARSVNSIIKAYNLHEGFKKSEDRETFKKIGRKYLSSEVIEELFLILKISETQRISPINYQRSDKMILLHEGKYNVLTFERLINLNLSIKKAISRFPV